MNTAVQPAFDISLTERYRALSQVSRALMSHRSQEDLPQTLSSELRRVMDFYCLGVGLFDAEAHEVDLRLFDETGTLIPLPHLATEETFTWWVYQEQQPLVIASVEEEVRFPASVKLLREYGVHSVCVLPLTTAHRRIGVLSMGSKAPDAFSKQEVCFLTLVANQVALALDDAGTSRLPKGRKRNYSESGIAYTCFSNSPIRLSPIWSYAICCVPSPRVFGL